MKRTIGRWKVGLRQRRKVLQPQDWCNFTPVEGDDTETLQDGINTHVSVASAALASSFLGWRVKLLWSCFPYFMCFIFFFSFGTRRICFGLDLPWRKDARCCIGKVVLAACLLMQGVGRTITPEEQHGKEIIRESHFPFTVLLVELFLSRLQKQDYKRYGCVTVFR